MMSKTSYTAYKNIKNTAALVMSLIVLQKATDPKIIPVYYLKTLKTKA